MSQYPKSKGALFINAQKAGEKHPDLRGHLHISAEQIQVLVQLGQSGQEVKLQVAGWQRVSQAGAAYIYLEGEAYIKLADQGQPQAYAQPQQQVPQPQMMPQQPQMMPQQPAPQQQIPQPPPAPQQVQTQSGWGQQGNAQPVPQPPQQPQGGYASPEAAPDFADDDIPF